MGYPWNGYVEDSSAMTPLAGSTVLVVDADADTRELLELFLGQQGAAVRLAASAHDARRALADGGVDVVLMDTALPDEDGFVLRASLRGDATTRDLPVIALTGRADVRSRARATEVGFEKFITKPFDVFALPAAITSVLAPSAPPPGETDDQRLERLVVDHNVRAILTELNADTPYRFTSVLRFDADRLESVWTFDRENRRVDTFPPAMAVTESYCGLVGADRTPLAMADSLTEPRAEGHPARGSVRAYCGVPLFAPDGSVYGTLCHYDHEPRPVRAATLAQLERLSGLLSPFLPKRGA